MIQINLNGETTTFENIKTVEDLVNHLGYANKRIAIEANGNIVPRSEYAKTELVSNDSLEIITAVGGG